ncbi:MAG: BON domain-containing protein [Parachlamydiaceae bacterium]|nr:BON domain-containing protein [Parachlamydiaceae bacterium]
MKNILLIGAVSLCVISCERQDTGYTNPSQKDNSSTDAYNKNTYDADNTGKRAYTNSSKNDSNSTDTYNKNAYDADNTGKNVRDRNETLTSGDQSESEEDRTITQDLRRALMKDDSLSTNAKNVKIITIKRVITLRGPVANANEKENIGSKAKQIRGAQNVENLLEVTQQR